MRLLRASLFALLSVAVQHMALATEALASQSRPGPSWAGRSDPRPPSLWLAMGVIVTQWEPRFRRQTDGLSGIEWRWVTSDRSKLGDEAHVVVRCPDVFYSNATRGSKIRPGFQCAARHSCRDALSA